MRFSSIKSIRQEVSTTRKMNAQLLERLEDAKIQLSDKIKAAASNTAAAFG